MVVGSALAIFLLIGLVAGGIKLYRLWKSYHFYKENYENSRSFMNSLPGFVFVFTENLQYHDCNDEVLKTLKINYQDLIHQPLGFIHNNTQFAENIEKFNLSEQKIYNFVLEDKIDFSDVTKYFFCVLTKTQVPIANLICAVCIDITELHLQEKAISKRRLELFELEKLITIGELSSGLAHEVNNPLAIISGRIHVMMRKIDNGTNSSEYLRDSFKKILDSTSRINRIIQSLRILSKDSISPNIQVYKTQEVLEPIVTLYSHKIFFHCILLTVTNDYKDVLIKTDLAELSQVVLHLLSYMIGEIKDDPSDKWLKIEVHQTPIQIQFWFISSKNKAPKEQHQNIAYSADPVDPFHFDGNSEISVGLNLFTARNMLTKQNGNLFFNENTQEHCFVLELPIRIGIQKAS
jgi:nitrogen-specific signal transduction histidine kinase